MIRQYFKQAWKLLKDNKLYSVIYILGTALAITMVMIVSVYLYIKSGNIPPEVNRSRMLYVGSVEIYPKDTTQRGMSASNLSLQTVKSVFYPLKSAETVTAVFNAFGDDNLLSLPGQKFELPMTVKYTDANYWNLFRFRFVEGKPYSKEEFASGIRNAVIDASTAKRLFGGNSAIGKTVLLNDTEYRVSGVVKMFRIFSPTPMPISGFPTRPTRIMKNRLPPKAFWEVIPYLFWPPRLQNIFPKYGKKWRKI